MTAAPGRPKQGRTAARQGEGIPVSGAIGDRAAALVSGGAGLAFSALYILAARRIEDSLLADSVGAAGVPVAIGGLMAVASVALIFKGLMASGRQVPTEPAPPEPGASRLRLHGLAAGLLLILAVYLLVLPWLGYIVSVGLMAAAAAWFAGGRQVPVLLGFAVLTGPLLWLVFDLALRIRMPAGIWRSLFSG